jgi:hypothetical protein
MAEYSITSFTSTVQRERPREKEDSPNDAHLRNENGPRNKTVIGSTEFVADLELADGMEVSPHKKRRGVVRSKPSGKDDAAGKCPQLRGDHATETDVDSEDSEQTSRNDGSTNTHSQNCRPRNHRQTRLASEEGSPPGKTD